MQQLWQNIQTFFLLNPEFLPALYILLSYLGIYLVALVVTKAVVAIKGNRKPFTDQIAHWLLIVLLVSLAVATIVLVVDLALDPMYLLAWYHWLVYAVLLAVNVLLAAALIASLVRE